MRFSELIQMKFNLSLGREGGPNAVKPERDGHSAAAEIKRMRFYFDGVKRVFIEKRTAGENQRRPKRCASHIPPWKLSSFHDAPCVLPCALWRLVRNAR
jgi:hypothetical protein